MSRVTEEHAARRILPSNRFDCELPPDVRTELVTPRRPPIPPIVDRPISVPKPESKAPFYFILGLCLIVLVGALYTSWRHGETAERARDKAISQPALTPQPTPTPITPMPGSASRWKGYLANNQAAPRAELIKLPPPRAQLVRLPEWRIGETRPVLMPYNLEVLATYKGRLEVPSGCCHRAATSWAIFGSSVIRLGCGFGLPARLGRTGSTRNTFAFRSSCRRRSF
jgi:hypothetical protein